jgi:hypothetical protein
MGVSRSLRSRALRSAVAVVVPTLLSLALALFVAPAASAGLREDPAVTTDVNPGPPMMLASTGLDITVPVVIGLAVLVLGTVMVGWAFLATGRKSQHR